MQTEINIKKKQRGSNVTTCSKISLLMVSGGGENMRQRDRQREDNMLPGNQWKYYIHALTILSKTSDWLFVNKYIYTFARYEKPNKRLSNDPDSPITQFEILPKHHDLTTTNKKPNKHTWLTHYLLYTPDPVIPTHLTTATTCNSFTIYTWPWLAQSTHLTHWKHVLCNTTSTCLHI